MMNEENFREYLQKKSKRELTITLAMAEIHEDKILAGNDPTVKKFEVEERIKDFGFLTREDLINNIIEKFSPQFV